LNFIQITIYRLILTTDEAGLNTKSNCKNNYQSFNLTWRTRTTQWKRVQNNTEVINEHSSAEGLGFQQQIPLPTRKKPFTDTVPLCKHFDLQSIKLVNLNEQVATMVRDV
jgi:hypothetical protein